MTVWIQTNDVTNICGKARYWPEESFWKKLDGIDLEKKSGYAFLGKLLPKDRGIKAVELKQGDIILIYSMCGSRRYREPNVVIAKFVGVDEEKKPKFEEITRVEGRDWAAKILSEPELVKKIIDTINATKSVTQDISAIDAEIKQFFEQLEKKYGVKISYNYSIVGV